METLLLAADELLLFCGCPFKNASRRDIIPDFSYSAAMQMLNKYTPSYNKLKLSIFDVIFSDGKSVSEMTRSKYPQSSGEQLEKLKGCVFLEHICGGGTFFLFPISDDSDNSDLELLPPVRICARLAGSAEGIEKIAKKIKRAASKKYILPFSYRAALKRQPEVQMKIALGVMRIKCNELAFVNKFNEEKFFRSINLEAVSQKICEFCERPFLLYLSALYAMTFCGLSFRGIYSVDEVFGAFDGDIRSRDNIKGEAAAQLLESIDRLSDEAMAEALVKMGRTLTDFSLPQADPNNPPALAGHYIDYCALSGIGAAYLRAAEGNSQIWLVLKRDYSSEYEEISKRAKLLSKYRSAKKLCEEIPALCRSGAKNITAASGYKEAEKFHSEVTENVG